MNDLLPLIIIPEKKECRIVQVNAGRGLSRRLIEMGFTRNAKVKVLRSDRGCLIISLNGSKFAISKGIAMKILVACPEH